MDQHLKAPLWRRQAGPEPPVVCLTNQLPIIPVVPPFLGKPLTVAPNPTPPPAWTVTTLLTIQINGLSIGTPVILTMQPPESSGPQSGNNGDTITFTYNTDELGQVVVISATAGFTNVATGYLRTPKEPTA